MESTIIRDPCNGFLWLIRTHKDQDTFFPTILEVGNGKETFATHLPFDIFQWTMTRWWFQVFLMFIPLWGKDPIWQMGWNHQLDDYGKKSTLLMMDFSLPIFFFPADLWMYQSYRPSVDGTEVCCRWWYLSWRNATRYIIYMLFLYL